MATHAHKIDSTEEIPDLCKSLFLTKEKFLSIVWILATLLLAAGGSCIAWAMTTNSSIVEMKATQSSQAAQIQYLNDEINKKLDILLKDKSR